MKTRIATAVAIGTAAAASFFSSTPAAHAAGYDTNPDGQDIIIITTPVNPGGGTPNSACPFIGIGINGICI